MDWFRVAGLSMVVGFLVGVGVFLFRKESYENATGLSLDLEKAYQFSIWSVGAAIVAVLIVLGVAAIVASGRRSD